MADQQLTEEIVEEEIAVRNGYNGQIPEDTPKKKAKRIILNHNFQNVSNDEWEERKRRRSTKTRGGYRHPEDAALAMIDCYYAANEVRAEHISLAVAAIHSASIMFNGRETQLDLGNQYDISPSTIQTYHHEMYQHILR